MRDNIKRRRMVVGGDDWNSWLEAAGGCFWWCEWGEEEEELEWGEGRVAATASSQLHPISHMHLEEQITLQAPFVISSATAGECWRLPVRGNR